MVIDPLARTFLAYRPFTSMTQQQSSERAQAGPTPLSALEGSGITAADLKKLSEAGYTTVEAIAFSTKKQLVEVKGISEAKADKVIASASQLVPMGFCTANDYHSSGGTCFFSRRGLPSSTRRSGAVSRRDR
jgi:DNA repair protein RAD51